MNYLYDHPKETLTYLFVIAVGVLLFLYYKCMLVPASKQKHEVKKPSPFDMEDEYFRISGAIKKASDEASLLKCIRAIWVFQSKYQGYIAEQCVSSLIVAFEKKEETIPGLKLDLSTALE